MTNIYGLIDIRQDFLYVRGYREGYNEAHIEWQLGCIKRLIIDSDFDDNRVAFLFGVTTELVKKAREELFKETFLEQHKKDFTKK